MAKTIMISNEVYDELKMLKGENKSFSGILKEFIGKEKVKRFSDLKNCFGILAKDKEWEEIEKDLERGWKNWSKKYV